MTEYMLDIENEDNLEDEFFDFIAMDHWTTNDGTCLKISEMETSHIQNCIKFLQNIIVPFPNFMTDMAQDCAEIEHEIEIERIQDKIQVFKDELKSRGIKC